MSQSPKSDSPPKKRQRSNGDGDQRSRSQEYWFEDGNIVLEAESVLFRVHQSVLSRHSQIFKDTFAMPQAASHKDDCVDGCPIVQVSDTAHDIRNLISLLYDNDKVIKFGSKLTAEVLGSMLRLGKKYLITYFQDEALDRLHHDYPTLLEDWDELVEGNRQIDDSTDDVNSTAEVISIAHEFRLHTILPAAYTRYLQLQWLEDLARDDVIIDEARQSCIIGNARILGFIKESGMDACCPPFLPSKSCTGEGKCRSKRNKIIKNLPLWTIKESETYGIFDSPDTWCSKITEDLCVPCRVGAKVLAEKVRSEFWSNLPNFFGLEAWADLKDG